MNWTASTSTSRTKAQPKSNSRRKRFHAWLAPRVFALTLFGSATLTTLQGQIQEPKNYTTKTDITYTQGKNGPLKADVYLPTGKGPFPAILYIHGGGWKDGTRTQMERIIKELASKGYAGFTIDYDLDPVHFPASSDESKSAIRYMRDHAEELHIDPNRIAVAGSSAGGELAALVALDPTTKVRAGIIFNGVLDLQSAGDKSRMVTEYLGGLCTEKPDACKDASPQSHVHPGAPPFYVGHGTTDQTVPFAQAEAFVAALRAAKVQVRFFTAKEGPHTYWIKPQYYADNVSDLESFLTLALKPSH